MRTMNAHAPLRSQLPLFAPHPRAYDVDFHAVSRPARTFTGDFYFTRRFEDRLWFAVGDVAGKGLNAAVVMAMLQEEIEVRLASCAQMQTDAALAVQRLDAFLRPILPANKFVTAVIGQLRANGTLVLANAGHCPPLIARRDGTVERIGSTGPVIGMLRTASWRAVEARLEPGDTLVVYSDGLLEARSPEGVELGVCGIETLLASSSRLDARGIADHLVHEAALHADGAREDDLTVVVIRA